MSGAGKGSIYRKVDSNKYNNSYDSIFPKPICPICKTDEKVSKLAGIYQCSCGEKVTNETTRSAS